MPRTRSRLLYALALLLFQELLFRTVFPLPELQNFNRAQYMPLGQSPTRRATSVANLDLIWTSEPDQANFVHHLNAYGFRDRDWRTTKAPGVSRIAFVGDSYVEGLMAEDHETIPAVFHALATASGHRVETMNAGIGGIGLAQGIQLSLDLATAFRPDTLCLILFANDLPAAPPLLKPTPPRRFHPWTPRLLELLRLWRQQAMLPRRGLRPHARFLSAVPDPDNPWSNPEYDRTMRRHVTPALYNAMRAGRFNPSRLGGAIPLAPLLREAVDLRAPLRDLRDRLATHGCTLRMAYLPVRSQVTSRYAPFDAELSQGFPALDLTPPDFQRHARDLTTQCAELGIPFLDLTPALRAAAASNTPIYWNYDDHPRAAGYRTIANALWTWWNNAALPP